MTCWDSPLLHKRAESREQHWYNGLVQVCADGQALHVQLLLHSHGGCFGGLTLHPTPLLVSNTAIQCSRYPGRGHTSSVPAMDPAALAEATAATVSATATNPHDNQGHEDHASSVRQGATYTQTSCWASVRCSKTPSTVSANETASDTQPAVEHWGCDGRN